MARSYPGVEDDGIDIRAVFGALRRRKAIILTTVAVVTISAVLTTLLIAPRYTATAALMLKPSEIRVIDMKAVAEGMPAKLPGDSSIISTQIKVLESRLTAKRVAVELGLVHDPEFNSALQDQVGFKHFVRNWLQKEWLVVDGLARHRAKTGERTEGDADRKDRLLQESNAEPLPRVVDHFLDKLAVSQEDQSNVISVSFTSIDPKKAAQIANALVDSYIESQMEAKVQETARASEWVAERTQQLREQVLQSEEAVEAYRAVNDLLDGRDGSLDAQRLASLNVQLIGARAERMARQTKLLQVRRMREDGGAYRSLSEVALSPIIINLRQREAQLLAEEAQLSEEYGKRHPRILEAKAEREKLAQKIGHEMYNLIGTLENELAVAQNRERALEGSLQDAKDQSAVAGRATIQLRELEREAAAKRSVYEAFRLRLKEIHEQRDLLEPDAEVISAADVPDEPSFPSLMIMTMVGLVTSTILASSLAALAEHLDRGVRTARQVEQVLDLPSLGVVPRIERLKRRQRPHHYLLEKPLSAYAEAVREVHMAMYPSGLDVPPQVVLVTSTLPGEGKTTLAMSLGASLARSGYKTLVMDLDLRHSSIARELDQPVRDGLGEFMAGELGLDEIIREDPREINLHVIPASARVANPSDLLGSRKIKSLLLELRNRYDCIVLDAPPALGTTDAKVAAQLADAVLFIVRWQTTPGPVAANGLRALLRSHVSVVGVVLTQVNLRLHTKYGYGDEAQYYQEHRNYYIN